jgi:hypothetical protein
VSSLVLDTEQACRNNNVTWVHFHLDLASDVPRICLRACKINRVRDVPEKGERQKVSFGYNQSRLDNLSGQWGRGSDYNVSYGALGV